MAYTQVAGEGVGSGAGAVGGSGAALGAGCRIVTVSGPTVTVPLRGAAVVFRATLSVTEPERLLVEFGGAAIHVTEGDTDQVQPVSVSIAIVTTPPFAETVVFVGLTL